MLRVETKGGDDSDGEWPASPMQVLENAVMAAGEALHNVYSSLPSRSRLAHHSEAVNSFHKRSNSLQRLKSHVQKGLRWGDHSCENSYSPSFNPEILANQKRQWYERYSKTSDSSGYKEPASLIEHFIIAGLHPDANLDVFEDACASRRKWESEMGKSDLLDSKMRQNRGPSIPKLEPQIIFGYPPGKKLAMRLKDLAAFCFPSGVEVRAIQRTPSLSDLNQIVYGQEHLSRDDFSFVFSLKVADNATLYGVCLHVQEFVQRAPAFRRVSSPLSQSSVGSSRFLVSAPRCYCVLTRVPFFELHYEVLNSIITQGRLNRITYFVSELALSDCPPPESKSYNESENTDSPHRVTAGECTDPAVPMECAGALTAVVVSDDDATLLSSRCETFSPESVTAGEASHHGQMRASDKDGKKYLHQLDDDGSELSENHSEFEERMHKVYEDEPISDVGTCICLKNQNLEHLGSYESLSSVRSMASEDDDDNFYWNDTYAEDEITLEWAKENKNDLLQIVGNYYSMPLPPRGSEIVFHPLEHLQAIQYTRLPLSALRTSDEHSDLEVQDPKITSLVNLQLAAAEEAAALSTWTTATICRFLSLENVLSLITGVLLEKQVLVVCSNLGVLCAIVLSLIPIIRPFQWQSLFLPVLPEKMLDFLDAPVPFIVGIQQNIANLKMKTSDVVHVDAVKDQVKMSNLPLLPQYKELISKLEPFHTRMSSKGSVAQRHPTYKCKAVQAEAAAQFLSVMREYLESLCSDLRSYSITNVQSNNDRVSVLLKDSFIESFQRRDQPFIKLFVDTQLFSVLSDSRL